MRSPADEALVRALQRGERAACAALHARFAGPVFGFAAARLGDEQLAEDITVETLAAVSVSIGRFDPKRASLAAWVYGIARRCIQAELRQRKRRKSVPRSAEVPLGESEEVAQPGELAEQVASRLDAARQVASLAAALSDLEMEVLTLHFADGLSLSEIGYVVRRSVRAVDSLLHRAKVKARESLGQE